MLLKSFLRRLISKLTSPLEGEVCFQCKGVNILIVVISVNFATRTLENRVRGKKPILIAIPLTRISENSYLVLKFYPYLSQNMTFSHIFLGRVSRGEGDFLKIMLRIMNALYKNLQLPQSQSE